MDRNSLTASFLKALTICLVRKFAQFLNNSASTAVSWFDFLFIYSAQTVIGARSCSSHHCFGIGDLALIVFSVPTNGATVAGNDSLVNAYQAISWLAGAISNPDSRAINSSTPAQYSLPALIISGTVYNFSVIILAFLTIFFWPSVVLFGLISLARRRIGFGAGILGILTFVFALVLVLQLENMLNSAPSKLSAIEPGGTVSLGYGGFIELAGSILLIVAGVVGRRARTARQRETTPPSTSSCPSSRVKSRFQAWQAIFRFQISRLAVKQGHVRRCA